MPGVVDLLHVLHQATMELVAPLLILVTGDSSLSLHTEHLAVLAVPSEEAQIPRHRVCPVALRPISCFLDEAKLGTSPSQSSPEGPEPLQGFQAGCPRCASVLTANPSGRHIPSWPGLHCGPSLDQGWRMPLPLWCSSFLSLIARRSSPARPAWNHRTVTKSEISALRGAGPAWLGHASNLASALQVVAAHAKPTRPTTEGLKSPPMRTRST